MFKITLLKKIMSNVMSPEVNNLLEQHSGKNQAFALFPGFGCLECRGLVHIFGSDRSTVFPLGTGVGVPPCGPIRVENSPDSGVSEPDLSRLKI